MSEIKITIDPKLEQQLKGMMEALASSLSLTSKQSEKSINDFRENFDKAKKAATALKTGMPDADEHFRSMGKALELGWSDVDAMLESMTATQYQEWLAFFRIRADVEKIPQGGYGASPEEKRRMSGDIVRAMSGYQGRRDGLK